MTTELSGESVCRLLQQSLSDVRVIMAYPNVNCPVRVTADTVAVAFSGATLASAYALESVREGEVRLTLHIYTPYTEGVSRPAALLQQVLEALSVYDVLGIAAQGVQAEEELGAYCVTAELSLRGMLGGESDE